MQVGVFDARNRLSELIEAVERGEEVVITRRGQPVARLVSACDRETIMARRRRALEDLRRMNAELAARLGRVYTWEELKKNRDQGRP